MDTVLKHHSDNEKSSAQRSQKQSQGSCSASARLSKSKQAVINSPETPSVKTLQQLSSDDELSIKRKKRGHSKDSRSTHRESKSSHSSAANNSPGSEEEKDNREHSALKSQKYGSHATRRPTKRVNTRKRITNPLESPPVNDETSQNLSSDDELPTRRRRERKGAHSKSSRNARSRPQPKHGSSSTKSEDSDNLMRHKPKHKSSKCTRAPAPTKTLAAPTQSSKKHSTNEGSIPPEHDEDKWTEAELMRLQE